MKKSWRLWGVLGLVILLGIGGGVVWGQAKQRQHAAAVRVAKQKAAKQLAKAAKQRKNRPLTAAQKRRRAADRVDGVGKILRTKKGSTRQPFVLANDSVKLYDSLKHVGNRYHVSVDGDEEEISPPIKVVVAKYYYTQKGTYCSIQNLQYEAVSKPFDQYRNRIWNHLSADDDYGYIALKDLKPTTYYRRQSAITKTPYYLTSFDVKEGTNLNMNLGETTYHAWSHVPGTVFRTFSHNTDTLLNRQLYATKQLIRTDDRKYLYMQTATGKAVGWLPATGQLIRGYYRDVGKRLLKPTADEKMTLIQQEPQKRTENNAYVSQSRIYQVYRHKKLQRLLILTAMNTPIKVDYQKQQPVSVTLYQRNYRVLKRWQAKPKEHTYQKDNEYGLAVELTLNPQSTTKILHFMESEYDSEGVYTEGTLYWDQASHFKSGIFEDEQ
ncbi:hypothetical protein [Lactiplantibacillus mudanjiangensis]|uniref:Uncharacterized protein n=1 Tax=Lactiplantibacillus mudanjiangensis TaxID=1296538 RepID=A0A660DW43_9LACO|nr:hypothetical protein [Lactiplantibacillus mudanjiangensis]VDG25386.1 hypothetical protein [Lactobacillus brevis] [Lactiplantibacillus mudanjiangensis]VDG27583.1 hypothetical protein [Lactobacillus brevis] [Lactiplantibacillus mudanjiangensis]